MIFKNIDSQLLKFCYSKITMYRVAGYYLIIIVVKFMYFWVAKVYGNNGTFYGGTKNIEIVVTKHFHIIRDNTYW